MKIAVKDLRPNPFRDLTRYPIDQDKVAALVASIRDTDFWDNLVARPSPNGAGGYELAYGVHRWAALKKAKQDTIDIPVRNLDDTMMARIMVHENQSEWATSALVAQESVRAVVKGFAAGKIELPKPPSGRDSVRTAPSFVVGESKSGRPDLHYTAATLAKFFGGEKAGWSESKIEAILGTLSAIEKSLVDEEDLEGLSVHQAAQVAIQARRVEKATGKTDLAKSTGKNLAYGMRSATGRSPGVGSKPQGHRQAVTYHGARHVANQVIAKDRKLTTPKVYPPAGKAIPDLAMKMYAVLSPESTTAQKVEHVIAVKEDLHPKDVKMLANALRGIAKRATHLADRLEG